MTDKQDPIAHAARLLREAAEELRQAHAYNNSEGWENETDAKAAYDGRLAAARALEDWEAAIGAGGVQPLRSILEGCKVVPLEPTPEMLAALMSPGEAEVLASSPSETFALMLMDRAGIRERYSAMLGAAPQQEVQGPAVDDLEAVGAGGVSGPLMGIASISANAGEPRKVFLVATGEEHEGEATYTRYDDKPPPLCDSECLFAAPPTAQTEGWRLVPVEPTVEQEWEGKQAALRGSTMAEACKIYKAMIAKAPNPPTSAEGWSMGERSNPNNCASCRHKQNPDGGHCYMFRFEPTEMCAQHTLMQFSRRVFEDVIRKQRP